MDFIANERQSYKLVRPEPTLLSIKNTKKDQLRQPHVRNWRGFPGLRYCHIFIGCPSAAKTEKLLQMSINKVRMAVGLSTCHSLNKHLHTIGVVEVRMKRQHVLGQCLALDSTRLRYLEAQLLKSEKLKNYFIENVDGVNPMSLSTMEEDHILERIIIIMQKKNSPL